MNHNPKLVIFKINPVLPQAVTVQSNATFLQTTKPFRAIIGLPTTDKMRLEGSGSRLTRPPTPASTPAAVSRIRCWSRQQPPGDGARERVRCAKFAGLLGGILPQGVLVEGFGGRRHHLQVPKRGTLRFPLRGGWGAAGGGWGAGEAGEGGEAPLGSEVGITIILRR